ncbi:MAG: CTP--phosphocholine cytidylyltransferase [Bacilli bacterium]|nr:CTP--phosphocholine cytidylyltransferase [Bacilli bacterium]
MTKEVFEQLVKLEQGQVLKNAEMNDLSKFGYVTDNKINNVGLKALEPYRVKRVIIMAAGFGSRMVPITLTMPKPMVKVNGVRFIETLIQKCVKQGIFDIVIVRGYLKYKFDELKKDYPFVKFVDNDLYEKENNIASAILITDYLENAYLCEADFYITGDDVIRKYEYENNYLGTKVHSTDDWCFDIDNKGNAINYRKGGNDCVQAFGISYWDKESSKVLREKLKLMYSNIENRQLFWEMCIFDKYKEFFNVKPRYVNKESIVEIDSFDELCAIDPSYKK